MNTQTKEITMTAKEKTITQIAIGANLAALCENLTKAAQYAQEGHEAMEAGEQNQAIGSILYLETMLGEATALYNAAIALHRTKR